MPSHTDDEADDLMRGDDGSVRQVEPEMKGWKELWDGLDKLLETQKCKTTIKFSEVREAPCLNPNETYDQENR
jgi:hypothetical protein